MKKTLSSILASLIMAMIACQSVCALAPQKRDGVIFSGNTSYGKRIALTFDDGPHPSKTKKILDILDKYDVKATFFIIGSNAEYYPDIVAQEVARGHEVANHSYSHTNLSKCTAEQIKREIELADRAIEKASGVKPRLFRPPEGAYSENSVKIARELGKNTIIWTVDTMDWANRTADDIIKNIKSNVRSGSIILFHDFTSPKAHTIEALETIIPYLKSQGFEFVTVSDFLPIS